MHRVTKSILIFLVAPLLLFAMVTPGLSQEGRIYLEFRNQKLSATIEDAPLGDVLRMIREKTGIGYKVWLTRRPILDEKISVRFTDLSVREGLERIFSDFNRSFIFERNTLVRVMLFGKKETRRSTRRTVRDRRRRTGRRTR